VVVRVLGASHRDRFLLTVALVVLVLNVALNLALLPVYGYEVAALTSVASEVVVAAASFVAIRQALGFVPHGRYLPTIAAGAAIMVGLFLVLPGNRYAVALLATTLYGVVLIALPGTVRDVAAAMLPQRRRASQELS
jgi:peptidoglycan biosynthesis protein MviN/MurJ (putative lipid II flippase)